VETATFTLWHWLVAAGFVASLFFFSRVLKKAGYSPWWAALGVVPIVNIILLWVFAFARWPALPGR
jgi:hypothetical protein